MRRLACLVLAASLLAGCGSKGPASGSAAEAVDVRELVASGHLRRQIDAPPATLDPAFAIDVNTQRILDDLFEGLVRQDGDGAVVPGIARSWDHSADGLTWTFHLVPHLTWSNGDPLTAEDVVYAWQRVVDPATASQSAQQYAPIANAIAIAGGKLPASELGVHALDAQTLEVKLVAPTPYFLYLLTNPYFSPLHRATVERYGADWTRPANIVSNGAFVLEDLRINGAVQLKRNARYRDVQSVRLQRVTYYPVSDRSASTSRYLAGDVDVTEGFPVEDVDWLRERLGGQVRLYPYFGIVMLGLDVARPPFDSRALRLALSMAVDRHDIVAKLMHGIYLPAYSLVPPEDGYAPVTPDWAGLPDAERHARARELYAKAGYSAQHPLVVDLSFPTGGSDQRRVFEALAAMWHVNLGAEVHLANQEWRVHQQNRRLHQYRLFWDAWIADYPDPLTFLQMFQQGGGENYGQYLAAPFEQAVSAAVNAVDEPVRLAHYAEAERQLNADEPFIPVYYYESRHLVRPYVKGWKGNVMDRNPSRDLYLDDGQGG